jgi:phosphoglycerate dehydrogenase-like enzyme
MANIAMAGPPAAADFLREFGESLRSLGHSVTLEFAEPQRIFAHPNWPKTDLFVAAGSGCSRAAMANAPTLRAIVSPVIGVDGIDVAAAVDAGILVANGRAPENANSMAEATIMLMLACLYELHASEARLRTETRWLPTYPRARMLQGKTIGILGYGSIARGIVECLQGWGSNILIYTRHSGSLEQILRESDVLVVLLSLNEATHHLLNGERLALMKRDAILVNTSRGAIIDEQALATQVATGHLRSIALDVFATEPLESTSPLRALPNAILTPHCVGHTVESRVAIPLLALENVRKLLAGEAPQSTCNPQTIEGWQRRWPPLQ